MSELFILSNRANTRIVKLTDEQKKLLEFLTTEMNIEIGMSCLAGGITDLTVDGNNVKKTIVDKPKNTISKEHHTKTRRIDSRVPSGFDQVAFMKKVVEYLKANKISQKKLSDDIGINPRSFSTYKTGKYTMSLETKAALDKYCGFDKTDEMNGVFTDKDEFVDWVLNNGFTDSEVDAGRIYNWAKACSPNHESVKPVLTSLNHSSHNELIRDVKCRNPYVRDEARITHDVYDVLYNIVCAI